MFETIWQILSERGFLKKKFPAWQFVILAMLAMACWQFKGLKDTVQDIKTTGDSTAGSVHVIQDALFYKLDIETRPPPQQNRFSTPRQQGFFESQSNSVIGILAQATMMK